MKLYIYLILMLTLVLLALGGLDSLMQDNKAMLELIP